MRIDRIFSNGRTELLSYLARQAKKKETRVAPLAELSEDLGVGVAALREQLEVARVMGFVDIRPRKGIHILDYNLQPALKQSVGYAIAVNPDRFTAFSDLRNHVEAAYWHQAVSLLTPQDHLRLRRLVAQALQKLDDQPIQIPQVEHRDLHLTMFSRLDNPFVTGILETFWDLYETVGLGLYTDYQYLKNVWSYHQKIVEAIIAGNYDLGYQTMLEHTNLLQKRSRTSVNQMFE